MSRSDSFGRVASEYSGGEFASTQADQDEPEPCEDTSEDFRSSVRGGEAICAEFLEDHYHGAYAFIIDFQLGL